MTRRSPLEISNQIDQLADRFEEQLRGGAQPELEPLIDSLDGDLREAALAELLPIELEYAGRRGESIALADLLERFPRDADLVQSVWRHSNAGAADPALAQTRVDAGETHSQPGQCADSDESTELPAGRLGRYEVIRLLGRGGMGSVYLAHDTTLDRPVALKIPHVTSTSQSQILQRFDREARLAAQITHPNICPVYDVGEIDGRFFIAMAFVEGESLEEAMANRRLSRPEAVAAVATVARTLGEAHGTGIVHRDLKPSNIHLDQRGQPVVMDFGLAVQLTSDDVRLTRSGMVLGTPLYMAPEQVRGDVDAIGPATDVYCLGVILYEMLTGAVPFRGNFAEVSAAILHQAPTPPNRLVSDLDDRLNAACLKAMSRDPGARFGSMEQFAEELDRCLERRAPSETPPWHRRGSAIVAGVAGIVALLGTLLLLRTPHGTVQIELSDPSAAVEVLVDGDRIDVTGIGRPLQIDVGPHALQVSGEGYVTHTRDFAVTADDNTVLRVTLTPTTDTSDSTVMPPEGDREIAEWLIGHGGQLLLVDAAGDGLPPVTTLADLPETEFFVYQITLHPDRPLKLEPEQLESLRKLPELTKVYLRFLSLQPGHLAPLAEMPQLQAVSLGTERNSDVTDADLAKLVARLPNLVELQVAGLNVTGEFLSEVAAVSRIKRIAISSNSWAGAGEVRPRLSEDVVELLGRFPRLSRLSLNGSRLDRVRFSALESLTALEVLTLNRSESPETALPHLSSLPKLNTLDLSHTLVGDEAVSDLSGLQELTRLDALYVRLTPDGVERLRSALPRCRITSDFGVYEPQPQESPSKAE